MAEPTSGWVYLIESTNGHWQGWYRIGRTGNPIARFRQWRWMSKNNHWGLRPLYLISVDKQEWAEKVFHNMFDKKRTSWRWNGMGPRHEWFKLDASDLSQFLHWAGIIGTEVTDLHGDWQKAKKT